MSYYNALLLSYILILTFGYFVTFLLYYIFGGFSAINTLNSGRQALKNFLYAAQ